MMRMRLLLFALSLLVVGAASAAVPGPVPDERADARAWAMWVKLPGEEVMLVAGSHAQVGNGPAARAVPVAVGGTSPQAASADASNRESTATVLPWADPTGSMTVEGGASHARAGGTSAMARATVWAGSGSGFAMANQLFTWEQQEQMLNAWQDATTSVFEPLNEQLALLGPVLAPRGLALPPLEPPPSLGFVDVAGVQQLTSRSEASTLAGSATSLATTTVGSIRLFAGFIEIDSLAATAQATAIGDQVSGDLESTMGRVRIAGLEVEADGDGFRLASQDIVSRAVLAPVLDDLLAALDEAGVRLRLGEQRTVDGVRQVSALEVELATPEGPAIISLGHAEVAVTAPPQTRVIEPTPEPSEPTAAVAPPPPPRPAVVAPAPVDDRTATGPDTAEPDTGEQPNPVALRLRPLDDAARRSLTASYALIVAGVLGSALLIPGLVGRRSPPPRHPIEITSLIRPGGSP